MQRRARPPLGGTAGKLTSAELLEILQGDVVEAAPVLLGWQLVRGNRRARIVEVEAYRGADDPGCHAFYGRTPRTEVMFGRAGLAYVYFTYGMHWMLNVTAGKEGDASAILIRAAEPLAGIETMFELRAKASRAEDLLSGPAKLAEAFSVTRSNYGASLLDPQGDLRLEPGTAVQAVASGTRIGLAIGKGDALPWRFADADALRWVSRPVAGLRRIGP